MTTAVAVFSESFKKPRRKQCWKGRQLGDDSMDHPMFPGICVAYLRPDTPDDGCCQRLGLDGPVA